MIDRDGSIQKNESRIRNVLGVKKMDSIIYKFIYICLINSIDKYQIKIGGGKLEIEVQIENQEGNEIK
jgi:hypothetical protein